MKQYELLVVFKPNADSEEIDKLIAKLTSDIEGLKGSVDSVEKMGRKKLAYEIENFRDGFFANVMLSLPAEKVADLKRQIKLNDNIIRMMLLASEKATQEV